MSKNNDPRRRPHHSSTLIDVHDDDTVRDLADSLATEIRHDSTARILLIVGSFSDGIQLTKRLHAFDPYMKIESCGAVRHMRGVMPRNDTQVYVIPSMIAELGNSWPGFNVMYLVSCPANDQSLVQVVSRVNRAGKSNPRVRIFASTAVREVFENARWLESRIRETIDVDLHVTYPSNLRDQLVIITPQNSESPMMLLSDANHVTQVLIGFSTSGPDDRIYCVQSLAAMDAIYSDRGRDYLMRRTASQLFLDHNSPVFINRMREGSMLTSDGVRVGAAAQSHMLNTAIGNAYRNSHPLMTLLRRASKSVPFNSLAQ